MSLRQLYKATVLTKDEISSLLTEINRQSPFKWILEETGEVQSKLRISYKFKDYPTTWEFLSEVAQKAHKAKHHPTINTTYNKVDLELTTHDEKNQVTNLDMFLAQDIQEAYVDKHVTPSQVQELRNLMRVSTEKTSLSSASKIIEQLIALDKKV